MQKAIRYIFMFIAVTLAYRETGVFTTVILASLSIALELVLLELRELKGASRIIDPDPHWEAYFEDESFKTLGDDSTQALVEALSSREEVEAYYVNSGRTWRATFEGPCTILEIKP